MEKADKLLDLLKVFKPEPLYGSEFDKFKVDTYIARGRNSAGILSDYFNANWEEPKKVLFMGHRGSGKSTELYQVGEYLKERFCIINFSIRKEIDIRGIKYLDLIFLLLDKLFEKAVQENIKIDESILDNLYNYWHDEKFTEIQKITKANAEVSAEIKIDFLKAFMAKVKGVLATGKETKEVIRRHIEPKLSQVIQNTNDLIDIIRRNIAKTGKMPMIIIEDLDKLGITDARDLFLNHSDVLTDLRVHIIYTFPIFLNYSIEFNEIKSVFDKTELMSMIKVNTADGQRYEPGRKIIRDIVARRAELGLFEPAALEFIIERSGGALRDVFEMILNAALLARSKNRSAEMIDLEAAREAYHDLRSNFERIIFRKHIDVLKRIHSNCKEESLADENLMEMLACSAVIEYNGERWCALHPAVKDMLERKGLIGNE